MLRLLRTQLPHVSQVAHESRLPAVKFQLRARIGQFCSRSLRKLATGAAGRSGWSRQQADLEAQRIGTLPGDHRFRQSMSLAVSKKVTARAN